MMRANKQVPGCLYTPLCSINPLIMSNPDHNERIRALLFVPSFLRERFLAPLAGEGGDRGRSEAGRGGISLAIGRAQMLFVGSSIMWCRTCYIVFSLSLALQCC